MPKKKDKTTAQIKGFLYQALGPDYLPALRKLHLHRLDGVLRLYTSNRFSLAKVEMPSEGVNFIATVDHTAIDLLPFTEIEVEDNAVILNGEKFNNYPSYPDLEYIIKTEKAEPAATVKTAELLTALESFKQYSFVSFEGDSITAWSTYAKQLTTHTKVDFKTDLQIILDYNYLKNLLSTWDNEYISLSTNPNGLLKAENSKLGFTGYIMASYAERKPKTPSETKLIKSMGVNIDGAKLPMLDVKYKQDNKQAYIFTFRGNTVLQHVLRTYQDAAQPVYFLQNLGPDLGITTVELLTPYIPSGKQILGYYDGFIKIGDTLFVDNNNFISPLWLDDTSKKFITADFSSLKSVVLDGVRYSLPKGVKAKHLEGEFELIGENGLLFASGVVVPVKKIKL